jgi:hypothetical protein
LANLSPPQSPPLGGKLGSSPFEGEAFNEEEDYSSGHWKHPQLR